MLYAENELDFQYPGIGANLFTMAIEGFLFFALTLLLEQEFFIHKIAPMLKERVEEPVEISPHDVRHQLVFHYYNFCLVHHTISIAICM